jgi:hypothetical protein
VQAAVVVDPGLVVAVLVGAEPAADRFRGDFSGPLHVRAVQPGRVGEHTLYDKLEQMSQDGSLHPSLVEWAKEIRLIGNAAAHPDALDPVSDEEAADLARLCRQLLNVIYEVPARIARNRAARGSTP